MNLSFKNVSGIVSVCQCSICVLIRIVSTEGNKRFVETLTLTVADTIPRLCNRYLTSINTRHVSYRSDLNFAGSYNLLQKCTILHVSGVDISTNLY
jgi:hypothetical protein